MLALEYGEGIIYVGIYALGIRMGITSPPDNELGLITYEIGPSGFFGTNGYYNRIVIDGNKLVIDAHGVSYYVDVEALNELFDDDVYNADESELNTAIQEHTYFLINDIAVSKEEFFCVFGREECLEHLRITDDNIREIIFAAP